MGKQNKDTSLFYDALFSGFGIVGTIGCFLHMYPLAISIPMFVIIMGVTTIFFLYAFSKHNKHPRILLIFMVVYALFAIFTYSKWSDGILYIINSILRVYEANSQYRFQAFPVRISMTELNVYLLPTLWLLFTPMCGFIVRSFRGRHSYFIAFIMSVPFIFSILLFTLVPHPLFFTLVLVFWFTLMGMAYASRYDAHQVSSTITKLGVLFGISALLVMLGIQMIVPQNSYVRDAYIDDLRLDIQTGIRNLFMKEIHTSVTHMDLLSAKNRFYIGSNELKVTMQEPQSLYLHGFSGSIYEENRWQTIEEETFVRLYDYQQQENLFPYNFVQALSNRQLIDVQRKSLTLTYLADAKQYLYTPYFAMQDYRNLYPLYVDAYIPIEDTSIDEYQFQYADIRTVTKEELDRISENTYYRVMRDMHLDVPKELETILSRIEIENLNQNSEDDVKIQRIQDYMKQFGEYTLSPGETPEDQDFITYFLTENRQGYCVHYASAATMLLRYYGIPARYASGFHINASDFENGSANIKDYHAHAWVEIIDPVLGWIPLEVTPSATSSFPNNEESGANPNPNNDAVTPSPTTPTTTPQNQESPSTTPKEDGINFNTFAIPIAVLVVMAAIVLRRTWIVKRREKEMCQEHTTEAIISCGIYLYQLQIAPLPEEIEAILLEAQFSNHPMSKEKWHKLYTYTQNARIDARKKRSLRKQLEYRYLRCLD